MLATALELLLPSTTSLLRLQLTTLLTAMSSATATSSHKTGPVARDSTKTKALCFAATPMENEDGAQDVSNSRTRKSASPESHHPVDSQEIPKDIADGREQLKALGEELSEIMGGTVVEPERDGQLASLAVSACASNTTSHR